MSYLMVGDTLTLTSIGAVVKDDTYVPLVAEVGTSTAGSATYSITCNAVGFAIVAMVPEDYADILLATAGSSSDDIEAALDVFEDAD